MQMGMIAPPAARTTAKAGFLTPLLARPSLEIKGLVQHERHGDAERHLGNRLRFFAGLRIEHNRRAHNRGADRQERPERQSFLLRDALHRRGRILHREIPRSRSDILRLESEVEAWREARKLPLMDEICWNLHKNKPPWAFPLHFTTGRFGNPLISGLY